MGQGPAPGSIPTAQAKPFQSRGGVWEPPVRCSVLCTPRPRARPSCPQQTVVPAPPSTINQCRWRWRWPKHCPGSLHPATAQPPSTHGLWGGDAQGTPKRQRVPSTRFPGHTFLRYLPHAPRAGSTRLPRPGLSARQREAVGSPGWGPAWSSRRGHAGRAQHRHPPHRDGDFVPAW